jgi:NAD(P)-dependent dehydrogenase (short-subunit alcohol dehydrogenase family)
MNLELDGKRALITGSTAGIGYAIARGLAAEGARVVITGRTQASVDAALARLKAELPQAVASGVAADCATVGGAQQVFDRVDAVDILVNNLGIYERRPFFEIEDAEWLRFFEVNVLSGVRFARRYARAMATQGWGRILFVSSESALNIPKEMIHYGMTKTAQLSVSRGLAMELAGTGVTVNAVLPGPTNTENTSRMRAELAKATGKTVAEIEQEFFRLHRPTTLINRFTSAAEVANLAVYLCGAVASGTSGAAMRVDGGVVNQIM